MLRDAPNGNSQHFAITKQTREFISLDNEQKSHTEKKHGLNHLIWQSKNDLLSLEEAKNKLLHRKKVYCTDRQLNS